MDNITRVINSYELNDLVNFIEFAGDDEDLYYNITNKFSPDCTDDVRSIYHAYRHYIHLKELISTSQNPQRIFQNTSRF